MSLCQFSYYMKIIKLIKQILKIKEEQKDIPSQTCVDIINKIKTFTYNDIVHLEQSTWFPDEHRVRIGKIIICHGRGPFDKSYVDVKYTENGTYYGSIDLLLPAFERKLIYREYMNLVNAWYDNKLDNIHKEANEKRKLIDNDLKEYLESKGD